MMKPDTALMKLAFVILRKLRFPLAVIESGVPESVQQESNRFPVKRARSAWHRCGSMHHLRASNRAPCA